MRPQEFLALLLDTLHEELKAENTDQVRSTFLLNASFHFNENKYRELFVPVYNFHPSLIFPSIARAQLYLTPQSTRCGLERSLGRFSTRGGLLYLKY
jgi:hypothetical protein